MLELHLGVKHTATMTRESQLQKYSGSLWLTVGTTGHAKKCRCFTIHFVGVKQAREDVACYRSSAKAHITCRRRRHCPRVESQHRPGLGLLRRLQHA